MGLVEQAQGWFEDADVIVRVENTYQPYLNNTRWKVTEVGKSYFLSTPLTYVIRSRGRKPLVPGKPFRGGIPTRARDVLFMNETQITMRLGDAEHLKGHSVTYRKEVR